MIRTVSGQFYRAIFAHHAGDVLNGVKSPEGRFHHDGEPALYLSPTAEATRIATAAYLREGDTERVIVPVQLDDAALVDLREEKTRAALGLQGHEPSAHWRRERAAGRPAISWIASDAARATNADGMIYTSRSDPSRWHLVLFRWNGTGGPQVSINGPAIPFSADQSP